ncbi:hypothetical protein DPMN_147710 [Dreissena polymorpha]|uniref:C2H2-type domain-containing protein n=1 Tax=Dreissena polymorpha TaxID=45954 RepID=A0A9D4J371_DREPO|nr:hypothetical protein DPMN_147710 [Dreissena polymorpha]
MAASLSRLGLCRICGKAFRSASGLNDHERKHTGVAPYRCCGRMIYSKANLTRHRCAARKETKEFVCETCGRSFAIMADLRAHMTQHQEATLKCDT